MAARARCRHPTKISQDIIHANRSSRPAPRRSQSKHKLSMTLIENVRFICEPIHSTSTWIKSAPYFNDIWPKSCSASHRIYDGLSTGARALRRSVCPRFWFGEFGKVTSRKTCARCFHRLAPQRYSGCLRLVNPWQLKHLLLLNMRRQRLII